MRILVLAIATTSALLLSACAARSSAADSSCAAAVGASMLGRALEVSGELRVDQHGDFLRLAGCIGPAIRVYGIRTANGAAAEQLRNDIDSTLTLFDIHWVIDATARVERDKDGLILHILTIQTVRRAPERPNNSFKPTPLRGAA